MKKIIFFIISFSIVINSYSTIVVVYVTEAEQFVPSVVNVSVGDTIEWRHLPSETSTKIHSIWSSNIPPNAATFYYYLDTFEEMVQYQVTEPGTYDYYCYPHGPAMHGSFIATGATGLSKETLNDVSYFADNNFITLSLDPLKKYQLSLISINGIVIENKEISNVSAFVIDIHGYAPNLYLLNIISEGKRKTVKILKQ